MTPDTGKHGSHESESLQDAAGAAARGAHKVADKAGEWRDRGAELASEARARAGQATEGVRGFMRDRPIESATLILAAGWLLGRLLSRRR